LKIPKKFFFSIVCLVLLLSCQKQKDSIAYKNNVINLLSSINNSNLKDIEKEKKLDSVSQYVLSFENDSINRNLIFKIANQYYFLNYHDKYVDLSNKVLDLSIQDSDTTHIAKSLCYIGNYHDFKSQYDSAFVFYNKSEKLYKTVNDTVMLGMLSILKGSDLLETGNFAECEVETIKALKLVSMAKRNDLIYNCYNIIALSLKGLNSYEEALNYFDLALKQLEILEKENFSKEKIQYYRLAIYNNIGRVYEIQNKFLEAIKYYNKGLLTKNLKKEFPKSYAMLLDNLAYAKLKLGYYNEVPTLLAEAMKVSNSLQIKNIYASSKINYGEYYLVNKDTAKGLTSIEEGLLLSKKIAHNELTLKALKLLSKNDVNKKTHYSDLYIKLSDSLQTVERITRNKFARIAYESEQLEENNEVLTKKYQNIIISSLVGFLFLITLFVVYRLKIKNKELLFIQEQQESNEKIYQLIINQNQQSEFIRNEERNKIAMELHDGIVNRIFTARFNLMQLQSEQSEKKDQLIKEMANTEIEIRKVSHELQQNLLFQDNSFQKAIISLVESQQNEFQTKFDISIDKYINWSLVTSENKIHIYRIIQEALNNINKYSKAEKCNVFILKTGDKITFRISDDGVGFDPDKKNPGIGLKNIKQRVKSLNGVLKITSDNSGTLIEVVF
jgi:signal transduction histidine kinase